MYAIKDIVSGMLLGAMVALLVNYSDTVFHGDPAITVSHSMFHNIALQETVAYLCYTMILSQAIDFTQSLIGLQLSHRTITPLFPE